MAKVYYDRDADLSFLDGKIITIIGYGSQGHAHAQNLRDSGAKVIVALHQGSKSKEVAEKDGFEVCTVADAVKKSDVVMFLMPDHLQATIYKNEVLPNIRKDAKLALHTGLLSISGR